MNLISWLNSDWSPLLEEVPEDLSAIQKLDIRPWDGWEGKWRTGLPADLSLLTGVRTVDVSNRFNHEMVEALLSLPRLEHLGLTLYGTDHQLEALSRFSDLTSLSLFGEIEAIPQAVYGLSKLEQLRVFNSERTLMVHHHIGQLTQLRVLELDGRAYELPESAGALTRLEQLRLHSIGPLPRNLDRLTRLQEVHFLPDGAPAMYPQLFQDRLEPLKGMKDLRELWLRLPRSVDYPSWLGDLTHLVILGISAPPWTELPAWLRHLTGLKDLTITDGSLTTLPDWIGALHQLEYLRVGYNEITTFPDSIRLLSRLVDFQYANNQLPEAEVEKWEEFMRLNRARRTAAWIAKRKSEGKGPMDP